MKDNKFEEWYNNYLKDNPYIVHPNIALAEKSWNACKEEILNILYEQCSIDGYPGYYRIRDKIENI